MTDMSTVIAIVAMETPEDYNESGLDEVLENAFKDEEVIFSQHIPKSCIEAVEANIHQIAKYAYGKQMEAGYEFFPDMTYIQTQPADMAFGPAIVDVQQRPKWAQKLRELSNKWNAFLRNEPSQRQTQKAFGKEIEPELERIFAHLNNESNQDREMSRIERHILVGFFKTKLNFYNDAKQ